MSELLDTLRDYMRSIDIPPPRKLHCGRATWEMFRSVTPKAIEALGSTSAHLFGLSGIPVHIDDDMPDAAWTLTENGEVVASGDLAPDHRRVVYVPGVGMVAFRDEETA